MVGDEALSTARHLLVVDDESSLLQLMQKYLVRLGYTVEVSSQAEDALARFTATPSSYALVIADLNLPGMSGGELLRRILEVNPAIRILVCSGYPFDPTTLDTVCERQVTFLQKPFLPKMLAQAIGELLA